MGFDLFDNVDVYVSDHDELVRLAQGRLFQALPTLSADANPQMEFTVDTGDVACFDGVSVSNGILQELTNSPFEREIYIEFTKPIMTQARWHKKKRINKKWLKRYGMKEDTITFRCRADVTMYDTYTGEFEFNTNSADMILRPDQKRKHLKIEGV